MMIDHIKDMMDLENISKAVVNKITNSMTIRDESGDEVTVSQDLVRELNDHADQMDENIVEVLNDE